MKFFSLKISFTLIHHTGQQYIYQVINIVIVHQYYIAHFYVYKSN